MWSCLLIYCCGFDVIIYDVVNVWVVKSGVVNGVFGWVVRFCVVSECVIN